MRLKLNLSVWVKSNADPCGGQSIRGLAFVPTSSTTIAENRPSPISGERTSCGIHYVLERPAMSSIPTLLEVIRSSVSTRTVTTLSLGSALMLGGPLAVADDWNTGPGGSTAQLTLSGTRAEFSVDPLAGKSPCPVAQQAVTEGNTVVMARITSLSDTLGGTTIIAHNLTTGRDGRATARRLPRDRLAGACRRSKTAASSPPATPT